MKTAAERGILLLDDRGVRLDYDTGNAVRGLRIENGQKLTLIITDARFHDVRDVKNLFERILTSPWKMMFRVEEFEPAKRLSFDEATLLARMLE